MDLRKELKREKKSIKTTRSITNFFVTSNHKSNHFGDNNLTCTKDLYFGSKT